MLLHASGDMQLFLSPRYFANIGDPIWWWW